MSGRARPPRLARRLLRALLPVDMRPGVEGDFEEVHRRRRSATGRRRAWFGYWRDAAALLGRLALDRLQQGRLGRRPGRDSAGSASWLDVKLGLRMLRKYPGLTLIGGLGMAVAIAVGAGFFSVAWHLFYPTLPLEDGDRLVALQNWDVEINNKDRRAVHDFFLWRTEVESVEQISAFRDTTRNLIDAEGGTHPVEVAEMTASGFEVARVPPALGRYLVPEDERPEAPPVLVIGHDIWQSRFGSDPEIVGREVRLGSNLHRIVGVMPEGYAFPLNHGYWTAFRWNPGDWDPGVGPAIQVFGRLADGVEMEEAQRELAAIGQRSAAVWPDSHQRLRPQVLPYTYPLTNLEDVTLWDVGTIQLIATLLLVVVAMNVAVLSCARVATRRGEIAVRAALGASRGRIVFQLFVEALVLSAVAAILGLGLAEVGLGQVNIILEEEFGRMPFWGGFKHLSSASIPVIAALTTLAAVIVGVVPGLQATGRGLRATLSQLGGGTGLRLGRTWTLLIVAQVAIAVCGLSIGASMAWDQIAILSAVPNFSQHDMVAARVTMDLEPAPGAESGEFLPGLRATYSELRAEYRRRLEADPTVVEVTFASSIPGAEPPARLEIEGPSPKPDSGIGHRAAVGHIDRELFDALDVPILAGSTFPEDAVGDGAPVVANRGFAEQLLGGGSVLGRRVRYATAPGNPGAEPGPWYEIVGVVEELFESTMSPKEVAPTLYHPLAWEDANAAWLLVRVRGELEDASDHLREMAAALDPTLRVNPRSFAALSRQQEAAIRLYALVLASVMASVLLLAAAGVYALLSFAVTRQRREIGIRAALGALPYRILATVFSRAFVQLFAGVVLGAGLAYLFSPSESAFTEGYGPFLVPAVSLVMLFVGLAAAFGPARRGLRVDPTEALRAE